MILRFTKYIGSFLALALALATGAFAQETRRGFADAIDCGLLTNPVTDAILCLQTTTTATRTKGHLYLWNGTVWSEFIIGSGLNSLNGLVGASQTFINDTNVTINSTGTTHDIDWAGTLAIARGGTASSTASGARTALGLAIGGDVQAFNSNLSALAANSSTGLWRITGAGTGTVAVAADIVGLFTTCGATEFLRGDGDCAAGTISETDPVVGAINGIVRANGAGAISAAVAGTHYVAPDAELTAIAGLTSAADTCFHYTGSGTAAVHTCAAFGRSIIATASESAFKSLVNIETGVNNQTGTSYTVLDGDRGKLISFSNGSSIAVTLPNAAGAGFDSGWFASFQNRGAGAVTITPTTSTIDGASSLVLNTTQGVMITSDGTNYFTLRGIGGASLGPDLTALEALTTTGCMARSAADTYTMRTMTGTANRITLTNGDCVAGNPTFNLGSLAVQTDQANTWTTGNQDMSAATSFDAPRSAGAAPVVSGRIAYDTTAHLLKYGENAANTRNLVSSKDLQSGLWVFCNPSGGTDSYTCTVPGLQAYTEGMFLVLNPDVGNTTGATINVSSLGVKNILTYSGATLATGDLTTDSPTILFYDGASFRMHRFGATEADTLDTVFNRGKVIVGANNFTNAVRIGTASNFIAMYDNSGVLVLVCAPAGVENDCDHVQQLNTGKSFIIKNNSGAELEKLTEAGVHTYTGAARPRKSIWFGAESLSTDGTQCATPAEVTLASGPKSWTILCTDNDASTIYGKVRMPDSWDGGTVTFSHVYVQTAADTGVLNGDIACQARSNGEAVSNTWGTEVAVDDAAVVGSNSVDQITTAAVTCSGTSPAGGDVLWFRYQLDATGTTTAVATLHHLGFNLEYVVTSRSD